MNYAGQQYVHSGAFNANRTVAFTLLGCLGAIVLGWIYAGITKINPFIYLNFLALIGVAFGTGAGAMLVAEAAKVRNTTVFFFITIIMSFTAWYAQWSCYMSMDGDAGLFMALLSPIDVLNYTFSYAEEHSYSIGKFGRDGLPITGGILIIFELIEFVAFMTPVYFTNNTFKTKYFCENCLEFNTAREYFADDIQVDETTSEKIIKGDLTFLADVQKVNSIAELASNPEEAPTVYKMVVSNCPTCKDNAIVDIYSCNLKLDDKKNRVLKDETSWMQALYVNEDTRKIFESSVN